MKKHTELLVGIALGAGLMYILDPNRGARRRALIRDQVNHGVHEIEDLRSGVVSKARHLRNRARGVALETRSRLRRPEVDDSVLEERVRSELGMGVDNPSAIAVSAEHGRVTLRGTAAEADMTDLVERVQSVPGVHDVINRMHLRKTAG